MIRMTNLFEPFPETFNNDSAFFDRIHAYLPGWETPKLRSNLFTKNYGLITDCFAEFCHSMRKYDFTNSFCEYFALNASFNTRDTIAVGRTFSGLAKLIYPDEIMNKEEVRELGRAMGLPEYLVSRQPFPGPGLAIRVIGELTREKVQIVRDSDRILRQEIEAAGIKASQYFTVLTGAKSVGVMGDERTYAYAVAIRAVTTDDFMTAEWARLPYEVLEKASNRITNEIKSITRVVYDITSKPPATVEWE